MSSRFPVRLHIVVAALWQSLLTLGQRHPPGDVRRVLVTHHPQMPGDTLEVCRRNTTCGKPMEMN
jgi:hypothetical protein